MLEYSAYADFNDQMSLEDLFKTISLKALGTSVLEEEGTSFDFSKPFKKITLKTRSRKTICKIGNFR